MGGTQLKGTAVRMGGVGRWGVSIVGCGWVRHSCTQVSGATLGMDGAVQTDVAVLG